MTAQIVEIAGQRIAMLPAAEYEQLLNDLEDRDDMAAAELAQRRRDEGVEYLPSEMVDRIIDGENALRVWREYRGMSAVELASQSGFGASMITMVETGKRQGTIAFWKAVAAALSVSPEDIMPI